MLAATIGGLSAGAATSPSPARLASRIVALATHAVATPKISPFCTDAANAAKTNPESAVGDTPSSILASFNKLKAEEPTIIVKSPSQIRGDFQTLFNYFNKFYGALAAAGYNFEKLSASFITGLQSSEVPVENAAKAIESYLAKNCGVTAKP